MPYYQDTWTTIYHGDCLQKMKSIPDCSVDMVLTDPPYGRTACRWDSVISLEEMWDQLRRVIKPRGVIALMAQTPFDKVLGASNLKMLRYEWIWHKNKASGHLNAKKMPMKAHENILIFYKKLPRYNPQKTKGHKPGNKARTNANSENYGQQVRVDYGGSTERYPRSVLDIPVLNNDSSMGKKLHPTQKPVALMEYLIKTYTVEGEVVLDFALGSGTTLVAAIRLGRESIGVEIEEKYCKIATERYTLEAKLKQYCYGRPAGFAKASSAEG